MRYILNFDNYVKDNQNNNENAETDNISTAEACEILEILEKLGYPIGVPGTDLYKDLIVFILRYLKGDPIRGNVLTVEEIASQLNDYFSQLYFDVARNEMDLGIKTFHRAVLDATRRVDVSKIDHALALEIFGCDFAIDAYASNALKIATYYYGLLTRSQEDAILVRSNKENC